MLQNALENIAGKLKQLQKKESAFHNFERKKANDQDFMSLVQETHTAMCTLKHAHEELGYTLPKNALEFIRNTLTQLTALKEEGIVDRTQLSSVQQQVKRNIHMQLKTLWQEFHSKKTQQICSKIDMIGGLVQDQTHLRTIQAHLQDSRDWGALSQCDRPGITKLQQFHTYISEIDNLENHLNLNDEVRQFINLVTHGKARISDLHENVLNWIKKNDLDSKFVIRYH